jgi:hypothetical protein
MKTGTPLHHFQHQIKTYIPLGLVILLFLGMIGCNFSYASETLQQTQTAIVVQQTDLATKATQNSNATATAQQATTNAQVVPPTPDLAATQVAASVQQTLAAQPPAGNTSPETSPTEAPPIPPTPAPPADLDAQIKQASILVYEDIVNKPSLTPYVDKTVKAMGLQNVKYDGSAKGWLKNDLVSGGQGGKPWDLVILAIEARGEVSGEYFEYLNNVLQQGSAVILEAWHLDDISEGTISPILIKCGVQVYPYFPKTGTINDIVLWPLNPSHPVLNQPNSGLSFTKVLDTWLSSFDLGSLMALTGKGDAQLLLGTNAKETYMDGALAVCMGGQLTLQTFSSHSFSYNTMYPMWENYIYNALKWRFSGGQ